MMDEFNNKLNLSLSHFFKGKVVVHQPQKGYRFSVDAPILADFLPTLGGEALEIGMGCGIISLLAIYKNKFSKICGIEIQSRLADLAKLNVRANGFAERIEVVYGDFRHIYDQYRGITTVFSNPPYMKLTMGRSSPNQEVRGAKAEVSLNLNDLMTRVFNILAKGGNFFLILPWQRLNELKSLAETIGFYFAKLRVVSSFYGRKGERILIQLTNIKVPFIECSPLIIFKEKGIYSDEMERVFSGKPDAKKI